MASQSEKTFGSRFHNAQTILTYLQSLADYMPPQPAETLTNFKDFLDSIAVSNSLVSGSEQLYKASVKARLNAYRGEDESLFKLLAPIRGAVEAAYGKDSQQAEIVGVLIGKIRSTKLIAATVPAEVPPAPEGQTPVEMKPSFPGVSMSQQSYGSLTQLFQDLISTLGQFISYEPSNPDIQLKALKDFGVNLNILNLNVDLGYQKLFNERKKRFALYEELSERVQRIKAYLKAAYGLDSEIYKLVKGLGV